MSLLTTTQLSKFYGPDEVFSGVSVEVPHNARIALVGPNGAGKTTLLNLLLGHDIPTEGSIQIAKTATVGFLPQRPELAGNHTLWEEVLRAFDDLREMEAELNRLEHMMADAATHEEALAAYGPLQEKFDFAGGYTYELKIKMVLEGVGFALEDFQMPLPLLSGGQRTRALLARLLLEEPDLLLLDEPTNHLDIQAVEWLESYLKGFPGAVVAVSHDRYFMDNFASVIWEMEFGVVEVYRGNYSHYVQQRAARHERWIKEYEAQQEFIAKEEAFIRKHMGSRLTAQAKGRMKRLETMKKRGKIIAKPRSKRRDMNLRLQAAMRSGDKVLMTRKLAVGYDEVLFNTPDITLYRGETAALIGPNGVGKTTFIKTVIGQIPPLAGEARLGASVKVGYFAQAHERLEPGNDLVTEINLVKAMPLSETRNYLGQYMFSGDDVFRRVETLSGGERGRLALAKLSLSGANLLLLDEPTNHLDIESQEVLQEVLSSFNGTILIVSHDRYLIDALATQIWAASPGELQVFEGPYQEYLTERRKSEEAAQQAEAATRSTQNGKSAKKTAPVRKHGLNPYELNKRLGEVEAHIHELENRLEALTTAIETASAEGEAAEVARLGAEYTQAEADLEVAMEEWARLEE